MENTRRNFLKKVTVAGIGAAGLAVTDQAMAAVNQPGEAEQQKKKPAGKSDGMLRFRYIGTGSRCQDHINNV